jgi:hypothetical protein
VNKIVEKYYNPIKGTIGDFGGRLKAKVPVLARIMHQRPEVPASAW